MAVRFSDAWLDELRSRANLEEIVSGYVPLKQKGKRYWGCCPFHNEKTPSFSVDAEAQLYYCFGCHKGGTVIQFVMEMERMEFSEAVKYLAERVHMALPEDDGSSAGSRRDDSLREKIFEANLLAAKFYHSLLWTDEGAEALTYLTKRGLDDRDIRRFGLGASPKSWDGLYRYLSQQGFEPEVLEKAGLIVRKDDRIHDMFRSRVIFPIINPQGKILGFGGRAMGDQQPKYLNTPDTPVFNKRLGVYALNLAKKERGLGRMVLVEGYMDVVSLRRAGVLGVIATLGTALTEEQAKLIKRYVPEVWISYDGDAAGQKAALRALDIFDAQELPAKVLDYPEGMDPDDFVKAKGLEGFEALPRYTATEYRLLRARDGLDLSGQDGMTQYALRACAVLANVKSPIEMENNLRVLVQQTGYDREILLRQIGQTAAPKELSPARRERIIPERPFDCPKAESALLSMLARGLIPPETVRPEDFSREENRQAAAWLIQGKAVNAFIETIQDSGQRESMVRAMNFTPLPENAEDALEYAKSSLETIRRDRADERAREIMERLADATPEERKNLYAQLEAIQKGLND